MRRIYFKKVQTEDGMIYPIVGMSDGPETMEWDSILVKEDLHSLMNIEIFEKDGKIGIRRLKEVLDLTDYPAFDEVKSEATLAEEAKIESIIKAAENL